MKVGIWEGILFVTGEDGLSLEEIENILDISSLDALDLIDKYKKSLESLDRGIKLVYLGNKYKLATKE